MSFYFPNVDPTYLYKRSGNVGDEFLNITQTLKVRQNRVILREVPNYSNRVAVRTENGDNLTEVGLNATSITPTEYKVDYIQGVVYFHELLESEYVNVDYLGTGYVNIPAERVLLDEGILAQEETLQQFIDRARNILDDVLEAHENAEEATSDAIKATLEALQAVEEARDFLSSTIIINKPLVESYEDLLETYPEPENGWTIFVHDEGVRYRWDGQNEEWQAIDSVGGEYPLASETLDGMLSKEDFIKLQNIDEKNVQTRVMSFVVPEEVLAGVQQPHLAFPYSGFIEEITASVVHSGSEHTPIIVEKSRDYYNWTRVTGNPVVIPTGEHFGDNNYSIVEPNVEVGDIFRLNIPITPSINSLTLNIKVKI